MPAKKPTLSRNSNNKLSKKSRFPKWVIAVVVLSVAGIGLYLVYTSFAANDLGGGGSYYASRTIYCNQGTCRLSPFSGAQSKTEYVRINNNGRCTYLYSRSQPSGKYEHRPASKQSWSCINGF